MVKPSLGGEYLDAGINPQGSDGPSIIKLIISHRKLLRHTCKYNFLYYEASKPSAVFSSTGVLEFYWFYNLWRMIYYFYWDYLIRILFRGSLVYSH